jgi:hypothetical protein
MTPAGTSPTGPADQFTYGGSTPPPGSGGPTITNVMPNSGPTSGGYSIIVSGTNLGGATAVYFGTILGTITSDTPSSMGVQVPAHAAGTVDVTVVTPAGTSPITMADQFTYMAGPGSPLAIVSKPTPAKSATATPNTAAVGKAALANALIGSSVDSFFINWNQTKRRSK